MAGGDIIVNICNSRLSLTKSTGCRDLLWVVPQVQLCVWPGGGSGLQPRGCSPDAYDEPEGRNSVPGHTGLYPAGQRHSPIAQSKHLIVFVDD